MRAAATALQASRLPPIGGTAQHGFEGAADFVGQRGKLRFKHRFFRIDHNVHSKRQCLEIEPGGFAHPPPYTISLHGTTQRSADGKAHAWTAHAVVGITLQEKSRQVFREVPAPCLVDVLKFSALQQTRTLGELCRMRVWLVAHLRPTSRLLAKTGLNRNALASFGPPAGQHGAPALGLHAAAKTVGL